MIDSKKLITEYGIKPNKALGQNFLVDSSAIAGIASAADCNGLPVLEIGPGLGALTNELADSASFVAAVEIDSQMAAVLSSVLSGKDNVKVINKDFLRMKQDEIASLFSGNEFVVAANLPYYITSDASMKLIDSPLKIVRMVLMMQKEAAAHFTAVPGEKCYTPVSVLSQHYFDISPLMTLSPSSYYPEPAVDSVVLVFESRNNQFSRELSKVVKAAFSMRRKTIKNNIAQLVPKELLNTVFEQAEIDPASRAETLNEKDFLRLESAIKRLCDEKDTQ